MSEPIRVADLGLESSYHAAILARRLGAYRSKRFWLRSQVAIGGVAPNAAAAIVRERSESWIRPGSFERWLAQTTGLAIEHELAGSSLDIDGNPFDPDGHAFLERIGVTRDSHPRLFREADR
ncbi:hypothetical protein EP7_005570 (plasmid) [Isosphaeraceae bacterium EP7]